MTGPPTNARVVIVKNPRATEAFVAQPKMVHEMVCRGMMELTGKTNEALAWRSLNFSEKDVVGLKVYSEPGASSGTRPAVVEAVMQGLFVSGLAPSNLIIWDKRLVDLQLAGFAALGSRYNVRVAGCLDTGFDEKVFYDSAISGSLIAGDLEFDRDAAKIGRKSYVSKLVTRSMTKIISIAPLLNHNVAGVCGHLYSVVMSSIDNSTRFGGPEAMAKAVPEIYNLPGQTRDQPGPLGDRVVLCITDALIGQYQGEQLSLLQYATEVNEIWMSRDPVACDVLAITELDRERQARDIPTLGGNPMLYENAATLELGIADPARIQINFVNLVR